MNKETYKSSYKEENRIIEETEARLKEEENMKKEKLFKCPHCGETNDEIGNAQEGTTYYKLDIKTGDYNEYDCSGNGDNDYFCLMCDKNIDFDELKKQKIEL